MAMAVQRLFKNVQVGRATQAPVGWGEGGSQQWGWPHWYPAPGVVANRGPAISLAAHTRKGVPFLSWVRVVKHTWHTAVAGCALCGAREGPGAHALAVSCLVCYNAVLSHFHC